jgi:glutaredoxin 3
MKKVIIYTTPNCGYCHMAITFFKENEVEFTEKDASADAEVAKEMMKLNGGLQATPTIKIGDEVVVGFDEGAVAKKLEL